MSETLEQDAVGASPSACAAHQTAVPILTNRVKQILPHRRRPVPMTGIDPGLRRDGEEGEVDSEFCA